MSEFISYMLSNQKLIEKGQKRRLYAPLIRLIREGLNKLRQLLGLRTWPGESLFSNVRFNTEILISEAPAETASEQDAETDQVLDQVFGEDARIARIERQFLDRLTATINATRPTGEAGPDRTRETAEHAKKVAQLRQMARTASETAIYHGFGLNPREAHAFEAVHNALMSGMGPRRLPRSTAAPRASRRHRVRKDHEIRCRRAVVAATRGGA